MASVEIYIPTRGRISWDKQVTLNEFLLKSRYRPILVCPRDEATTHRRHYNRIAVCPMMGIGPTRQWILERASSDIVLLVDDDMKFQYRPDQSSVQLQQCSDLNGMVQRCIDTVLSGYIHGGMSARQGNNHVKGPHKDCCRNCNFHFLDRKKVLGTGARFDRLPVMEDFHFTLTLLTNGWPNRVLYDYCWNQRPGSIGGCSLYRTLELQSQAAHMLYKAFPQFVSVVKKHSKTGWSIHQGDRVDVRVQWAKAARAGGIDL